MTLIDLARFLAGAGTMAVFGALLFRATTATRPVRQVVRTAGVIALAGMVLWASLEISAFGGDIAGVLLHTWFGRVLLVRAALLLAGLLLPGWAGVVLSGASVTAGAGHGHAVAMGDSPALVVVGGLHALAAAVWIGGLLPLLLAVTAGDEGAARRFSPLGLGAVVVLAVSAAWQGWVLGGGLPGLVGTDYGLVLGLKFLLFVLLLALAAWHRFLLVPALPDTRWVLAGSIAVECGIGFATLAVAAAISQMSPGMHEQPWWPFGWRLSGAALRDPELRLEVLTGFAWMWIAIPLLVAGVRWRIAWVAVPVVFWLGGRHLDLLFVPAYPTSFYVAPGPTPASLDRGLELYPRLCARCHGDEGRGDGPDAVGLAVPPADLAAEHLWDHPDGELYWWLSAGMKGPRGTQVMPGFAAELSADDRWALIDLIRARNPHKPEQAAVAGHQHRR